MLTIGDFNSFWVFLGHPVVQPNLHKILPEASASGFSVELLS